MPRVLLIGFFVIQAVFDLAHSVTAFPFVHYGMFSESFAPPDSLVVFQVTVDGNLLDAHDFRIYHWDMIQNPLVAFDRQAASRDYAFDKGRLQSGLHSVGAGSLYVHMSANLNNGAAVADRFPEWYKTYLSRLTGRLIRTLRVDKAWYHYDGAHFILLKKIRWINL